MEEIKKEKTPDEKLREHWSRWNDIYKQGYKFHIPCGMEIKTPKNLHRLVCSSDIDPDWVDGLAHHIASQK